MIHELTIISWLLILILVMFVNSYSIVGFHLASQDGMIFGFIERYFKPKRKDPDKAELIEKPIYACPTCMASLHSVYVYWAAYFLADHFLLNINGWVALIVYPVYMLALACASTITNKQVE